MGRPRPETIHAVKCFFDPRQLAHAPERELHNGEYMPYSEHAGRATSVLQRLELTETVQDHGLGPIARVHDAQYLEFLQSAHDRWVAAGRAGDATGYAWPLVRRRHLNLQRIDAQLGQYSFDAATPITCDTWSSVYWAAQTALTATAEVLGGAPSAFALCRPPGHHAGADYLGGYCYLNNVAIAAQSAIDGGRSRVAILDVDYHHGNGTQDIFYDRGDVFFASIHADPSTDFPFYWGHGDERGAGPGQRCNLNLPLPRGTDLPAYDGALTTALNAIEAFGPQMLFVSFGADTFVGDPISEFVLQAEDFRTIADRIAALALPTVIVMEGGYAAQQLGDNVARFLDGFRR